MVDELRDRYGEMPEPVANLLAVARLRALAAEHGGKPVVFAEIGYNRSPDAARRP